jgi:hypothetical protein
MKQLKHLIYKTMKNTFEILIYTIVIILLFIFIAQTSISFQPFKVEFKSFYSAIGWIFIIVGVSFISHQERVDTTQKLFNEIEKIMEKFPKDMKKD